MPRAIGIDLGTTNSCMAFVDEQGDANVIINAEGGRTTPSVVARTADREYLVGASAQRQAATNPEHTLFSVKRLMGQRFNDRSVQETIARYPFQVERADNGDAWVRLGGEQMAPPEVAAMILQKLKADAEQYLGEDVTDAVITVPAYFDDGQRNATKAAGEIAGLNVRRIINEPTAAALAYGMDTAIAQSDQPAAPMNLAVYDLGGGTFDISILRLDSGVVDVVATSGDAFLGGDDFDALIVEHLLDDFRRDAGIDLAADPAALTRVKEAAETAKRELSTTQMARVNLPYITANQDGPKHLECELTREQLDEWADDLVQATLGPCEQALSDAQLSPADIDQVALIGGQTRMPLVQEVVRSYFGREPSRSVNPDEVVAVGAALQGGIMGGKVERALLLLDVTSQTLGTAIIGDVFSPIIERNTSIPTSSSENYHTTANNQTAMRIEILQGESPTASANRELGVFTLSGLRSAPAGEAGAEVTFSLDADGILSARAYDADTGAEAQITLEDAVGLTASQIEEMTQKAERRRQDIDRAR